MKIVRFPDFWELLIKGYVKKTFLADTRRHVFADRPQFTEGDYRHFSKGVVELNKSFTQERAFLPKNYLRQKELRSAYLLYFLPVNALKVSTLLEREAKIQFSKKKSFRVLDLGCGPGTGGLGVLNYLDRCLEQKLIKEPDFRVEFVFVDQNRQALGDAASLFESAFEIIRKKHSAVKLTCEIRKIEADLFSEKLAKIIRPQEGAEFDLIMALNFLSELPEPKRFPMVEVILKNYLSPKGRLLVMEPALRITSRDLMILHDSVVERESGFVVAPCLHQNPCPMLQESARDWCHLYIFWERPAWIEKIDDLVEIRKDYLKCSYLILSREPAFRENFPRPFWRVVSGALNSKGKTERLLCGESSPQLFRAMRLDKDVSAINQDFDQSHRGDIVALPQISRILPQTKIKKL